MPKEIYRQVQPQAFGELVREGVYSADFEHPPAARAFFQSVLRSAVEQGPGRRGPCVLDCGCGPGYWLGQTHSVLRDLGAGSACLFGFDITPEMVEVARARLGAEVPADQLRTGDILDDGSYRFGDGAAGFDLIFAYDVVQQLPRRLQLEACVKIVRHLSPGGVALIFDQDWQSPFGLRMEAKKMVTRLTGIELVPRYYCNARYPGLKRIAAKIELIGPFATEVRRAPDFQKRVLIVRSLEAGR